MVSTEAPEGEQFNNLDLEKIETMNVFISTDWTQNGDIIDFAYQEIFSITTKTVGSRVKTERKTLAMQIKLYHVARGHVWAGVGARLELRHTATTTRFMELPHSARQTIHYSRTIGGYRIHGYS